MSFRKYIVLVLIILSKQFLTAQFIFTKQYTYKDGLPSNEINCIYKDSRSILWVGTRFGVYVKDMDKLKMIRRFQEKQFNKISSIIEDNEKNLWFSSYGQGLLKFTGKNFDLIDTKKGLVSDRVREVFFHNGFIYVAAQGGVSIIDIKTNKIINPSFEKDDNIIFEAVSFFKYNNKIYVSTLDHGVLEVSLKKLKLINPYKRIDYSFLYKNNFFISSESGLAEIPINDFFLNKSSFKNYQLPTFRDYTFSNDKKSIYLTGYFSGTGNGMIAEIRNDEIINQTKKFEITSEYPNKILNDTKRNILYVGTTDKGLYEVHLDHYIDFTSINDEKIIGIYSNNNSEYFLSPFGLYLKKNNETKSLKKRVSFFEYAHKRKADYKKIESQKNKDFIEIDFSLPESKLRFYNLIGHNNYIWVATNLGIFQLNLEGDFIDYLPNRTYQFAYFKNQFIQVNPQGGILIFDDIKKFKYKHFSASQANIPRDVTTISQNKNAVFFGSNSDGLFKYENGKFLSYYLNNEFNETKIKQIKCIGDNQIMIATELAEVFILDIKGDHLILNKKYNVRNYGGVNISKMAKFGDNILIGTTSGLLIFKQNNLFVVNEEQGYLNKNMYSLDFNGKYVFLGVENGYYTINLDRATKREYKKEKVIITSVKVNDKLLNRDRYYWFNLIDRDLDLKNNENDISIGFSVRNTLFPKNYKFRYRLNPDETWSDYIDENIIFFRNLKYGEYDVQLEVTDISNNNKQVVDFIKFNIAEPFYLNIYFIILLTLALVLIVYQYSNTKVETVKRFNELKIIQLEEKNREERKRLKLENQLSEIKMSALQSQMNPHFIFNVLNSIQYYILDNDIDNALNSLGRFSHLVRQMLNISTRNEISLSEEIEFLKLYVEVENFRWKNKVGFNVEVTHGIDIYNVKIPPMLLQPLIENSFVHAFDKNFFNPQISLKFSLDDNFLKIVVEDNGKGFSNKKRDDKIYESKALKIIDERLRLFNQNQGENITISYDESRTRVYLLLRFR